MTTAVQRRPAALYLRLALAALAPLIDTVAGHGRTAGLAALVPMWRRGAVSEVAR